jgi:hypothetical protein
MSAKRTVDVDGAALRRKLGLSADATHEQVEAELAKPAPKPRRQRSRSTAQRNDATQEAYYDRHFPELRDGS